MATTNDVPEGYDENFCNKEVEDKYKCPICFLVMREVVQTHCGHKYCRDCLFDWMKTSKKCPICKDVLNENQVYPDKCTTNEILGLEVLCPKLNQTCMWKGSLKHLTAHINDECLFTLMNCPNYCDQQIQRNHIDNHIKDVCLKRKIQCQHCQKQIMYVDISQHLENCDLFPIECELCHNTSEKIPRREMEEHLKRQCPASQLKCPFEVIGCHFQDLRHQMAKHIQEEMVNHLTDFVAAFNLPFSSSKEIMFKDVYKQLEVLKESIKEYSGPSLETIRELHCNGTYIFKIPHFSQEMERAKYNFSYSIHSNPFYTSSFGYKMCLRINPYGCDNFRGESLSIFLHVMKGEWDDTLTWPFTGQIILTLFDRVKNKQFTEVIKAYNSVDAFTKPESHEIRKSKGFGFLDFIRLNVLKNNSGFTKDDELWIKCIVKVNNN